MNRKLFFAGVVAAVAMAAPASAQVTIDMSEVTCKQYAEYRRRHEGFRRQLAEGLSQRDEKSQHRRFALCGAQHEQSSSLLQKAPERHADESGREGRPLIEKSPAVEPGFFWDSKKARPRRPGLF